MNRAARINIRKAMSWLDANAAQVPIKDWKISRNALHCAALEGHSAMCKKLIVELGTDPNKQIKWLGGTAAPLHIAASRGHISTCTTLLNNGADVNLKMSSGRTSLMTAASAGRDDTVELLLKWGAIKCLGLKGLHQRSDHKVSVMLRYGSGGYIRSNEATRKAMEGLSEEDKIKAMMFAASRNIADELEMLLSIGVPPNILRVWRGGRRIVSPLHVAAAAGHIASCKILVNNGADVNFKTAAGRTPLESASSSHRKETVRFLKESGGKYKDQWTAKAKIESEATIEEGPQSFVSAAARGDVIACKLDIRGGRDPDTEAIIHGEHGRKMAALHLAAREGRLAVCEALLNHGANVNIRDKYAKRTPLILAANAGQTAVVALLLRRGAVKSFAVFTTTSKKRKQHILKLLKHGSGGYIRSNAETHRSMQRLTPEERTRLSIYATTHNIFDELSVLLSPAFNMEPNVLHYTSGQNVSLLHIAAAAGHVEACRVLLDNHADVNFRTNAGRTSFMSAVCRGRTDVIVLLLERGAIKSLLPPYWTPQRGWPKAIVDPNSGGYIRCNEATMKAMVKLSPDERAAALKRAVSLGFSDERDMLRSVGILRKGSPSHC